MTNQTDTFPTQTLPASASATQNHRPPPIAANLERYAAQRKERLTSAATAGAAADVRNALGPESPTPTANQTLLHGLADAERVQAAAEIDAQRRMLNDEIASASAEKNRAERGEAIADGSAGPREARRSSIVIAGAFVIEALILRAPVATLLNQEQGSLENIGAAALAAGIAALSGARAAEKYMESLPQPLPAPDDAPPRPGVAERRRNLVHSLFYTAALLLIVVLACTARITTLVVASQYDGIPFSMGEVIGIVMVQLMVMVFALGAGLWVAERSRKASTRAEDAAVAAVEKHHQALIDLKSDFDAMAGRHLAGAEHARNAAATSYRSALVDGFIAEQEVSTAVAWQHRFANEPTFGRADEPRPPTAPIDADPGDGDAPTGLGTSNNPSGDGGGGTPVGPAAAIAPDERQAGAAGDDTTTTDSELPPVVPIVAPSPESTHGPVDLFARITEPQNGQV